MMEGGKIDVGGGRGKWTLFNVHSIENAMFMLESNAMPGTFLAIGEDNAIRAEEGRSDCCQIKALAKGAPPVNVDDGKKDREIMNLKAQLNAANEEIQGLKGKLGDLRLQSEEEKAKYEEQMQAMKTKDEELKEKEWELIRLKDECEDEEESRKEVEEKLKALEEEKRQQALARQNAANLYAYG